jgi:hypothetical protein
LEEEEGIWNRDALVRRWCQRKGIQPAVSIGGGNRRFILWGGWDGWMRCVGEAGVICSRPRPGPPAVLRWHRVLRAYDLLTRAEIRSRPEDFCLAFGPSISLGSSPRAAPTEASYSPSRCRRLCGSACCLLPLVVDRPRGHGPRQRVVNPLLVRIALLHRCVTARQVEAEQRRGKNARYGGI